MIDRSIKLDYEDGYNFGVMHTSHYDNRGPNEWSAKFNAVPNKTNKSIEHLQQEHHVWAAPVRSDTPLSISHTKHAHTFFSLFELALIVNVINSRRSITQNKCEFYRLKMNAFRFCVLSLTDMSAHAKCTLLKVMHKCSVGLVFFPFSVSTALFVNIVNSHSFRWIEMCAVCWAADDPIKTAKKNSNSSPR